jgi:predicted phosphoribosyltransferase
MREEADEVICLEEHEHFGAIGLYYSDFRQMDDQDVIDLLARFPEKEVKTLQRSTIRAWRPS